MTASRSTKLKDALWRRLVAGAGAALLGLPWALTVAPVSLAAANRQVAKTRSNDLAPSPSPTPQAEPKSLAPQLAPTAPPPSPAPPIPAAATPGSTVPLMSRAAPAPASGLAADPNPEIAELEKLMFGAVAPGVAPQYRLDQLEKAVFQATYPQLPVAERVKQLEQTLLGATPTRATPAPANALPFPPGTAPPPSGQPAYPNFSQAQAQPLPAAAGSYGMPPRYAQPPAGNYPSAAPNAPYDQRPDDPYGAGSYEQSQQDPQANKQAEKQPPLFSGLPIHNPDFQKEESQSKLERYALELINEARANEGLSPLVWDELVYKIASDHTKDLAKRDTVSHISAGGENPDVRYSKAGGVCALVESVVSARTAGKGASNKAVIVQLLDMLSERSDDRAALMSPHATHCGFAFNWSPDHQRIFACAEIVTERATVQACVRESVVGDKVDVHGSMHPPYVFQRITLAWEGLTRQPPDADEEVEEALPYFPPLDYAAYAQKSEKDHTKQVRTLQLLGVTLAFAGSLFMPPVMLAAPLIMGAGGNPMPKAVSEIPVRGGVKVDGQEFSCKIPLSNENKEGIYYITVWATTGNGEQPVAVSRQAVLARPRQKGADEPVDSTNNPAAKPEPQTEKDQQPKGASGKKVKEKKAKKNAANP